MFRSEPRQHRSSETMGDRMHSYQAQPAATLQTGLGDRETFLDPASTRAGSSRWPTTQGGLSGLTTGPGRLLRRPQRV
jgi:hypothetical protein